jgi:hypothetical protein
MHPYNTASAPTAAASIPPETRFATPALVVGTEDCEADLEAVSEVDDLVGV